jgi:endonuclease/exonuclease/phosphatase family metal-dependent hydrolase
MNMNSQEDDSPGTNIKFSKSALVFVKGRTTGNDDETVEENDSKNNKTAINFGKDERLKTDSFLLPKIVTFGADNDEENQSNNETSPARLHKDFEVDRPPRWVFAGEGLPKFPEETKNLRVLSLTWNLYGKKPKQGFEKLINSNVLHHIISIGTEECWRSIEASLFYESKSLWVTLLRKYLEKDYVMIKSHSMNAMHLSLFVHKSILGYVKRIESAQVATGIGNMIGNKGAVAISFNVASRSFLFMNCHLASGAKQVSRRNKDFERIQKDMELPKARLAEEKKLGMKSKVTDRFDFVFWSGDFNYRVNQTKDNAIKLLKENNYEVLLNDEQLNIEKKNNPIFVDFHEGEIKFSPTYKYEVNKHTFDQSTKKRTPSWTDRILYKCNRQDTEIVQVSYDSNTTMTISDHRPVFSQFFVPIDSVDGLEDKGNIKAKTSTCNIF